MDNDTRNRFMAAEKRLDELEATVRGLSVEAAERKAAAGKAAAPAASGAAGSGGLGGGGTKAP